MSDDKDRSKPRILYVDDESRITRVIKYGLERYGFVVDIFNHPKLALSSFQQGVYDLLLIDIRLPEINGLDLCNELLKVDPNVKVCFITAYELRQEEIKNKVLGLETECIIKKPVSFETLVSKINEQLHRDNN
ncbi:response regulator [Candidatus Nitrososphaera gargensis]|uniref:response regulator n=1 Tax=Candidatus Nitrososphaera gargensis TaxID=497727 RepID=UPI001E5DA7E2|nr:response regulator [Candidatus Nitrososphaera gargensis]